MYNVGDEMIDCDDILSRAISQFGKEKQVLVAVEELSELQKEILKNVNRGKDNLDHIKEELVDVIIMIKQLVLIYGFTDEDLNEVMNFKLKRLRGCLDEKV